MNQGDRIIAMQTVYHKGRAGVSSPSNRFAPTHIERDEDLDAPTPVTQCLPVRAKTIISRNNSPDIPFYQYINPYQGCEHGCIYCYARPTHAYLDLSPGLDFETKLTYKINAAQQLMHCRELECPQAYCSRQLSQRLMTVN